MAMLGRRGQLYLMAIGLYFRGGLGPLLQPHILEITPTYFH